jgi:hypothetical protein
MYIVASTMKVMASEVRWVRIPAFVSRVAAAGLKWTVPARRKISVAYQTEGDSPPAVTFIEPSVEEHPSKSEAMAACGDYL